MSQGNIVQCIGAVVDIQFPRDAMPNIYNALQLDKAEESDMCEADLMFEVQQQLGDGVVRTIAMGSSDGLRRGMKVNDTGAGISVPVGNATVRPHHERSRAADRRSRTDCDRRAARDSPAGAEVRRADRHR
jgi:F-type H+-transporting ATPase subunit beta